MTSNANQTAANGSDTSVNTRIAQGHNGWKATTEIELGITFNGHMPGVREGEARRRVLTICTRKASFVGVVVTSTASVSLVDSTGCSTTVMGFGGPGGDFCCELLRTHPKRTTQAVIERQHQLALQQLQQVIRRARSHYALVDESAGQSADAQACVLAETA